MKNSPTFKLSKRTKTIMSLAPFPSQDVRAAFKNMMVAAEQVSSTRSKKSSDSSKD